MGKALSIVALLILGSATAESQQYCSLSENPSVEATLAKAADESRGLAMDSIQAAASGHLGLPLGAAEMGAVLFGQSMTYDPEDPQWMNRDRFVLSAGHGSMFLYSWLHMSGYDLPVEQLKQFRQHHSITPGHPESPTSSHYTPGVEATTGPLGTGIANAVGLAASEKMAEARYNTDDHKIFDHHVFVLSGDGCLQEGVSAEAMSFAAHEKLDNLILLFDSNDVTLDKMASYTQSEDHAMRFRAYGWDVVTVDGHDIRAIHDAVEAAKKSDNGKPTCIICRTVIGRGIPQVAGNNKAHGEAGLKFVEEARQALGLPTDKWFVSEDTYSYFADRKASMKAKHNEWSSTYNAWKTQNTELAHELEASIAKERPSATEVLSKIPIMEQPKAEATRASGATIINHIADILPTYVSGSADLHGSTKNYIKGGGDFGAGEGKSYGGKNFYYGIREHAMGGIANGIVYGGIFTPSVATFLVFADYMRATMRIAALAELPVSYILTHDSVGVGEDGPTHQPVETLSGLRVFPNMDVMRPCDYEETAAAFAHSILRTTGPTTLVLSRQGLAYIDTPANVKREGTLKGGYVIVKETSDLDLILIASGSEVQHAVEAAKKLGSGVRVVSMPSMSVFDRQSATYRESVLPSSCTKRIAIEAGVESLWYKYVGLQGRVIGINRFGFSAPGSITMSEFGMNPENIVRVAKELA